MPKQFPVKAKKMLVVRMTLVFPLVSIVLYLKIFTAPIAPPPESQEEENVNFSSPPAISRATVDILWGQPIKLIQVVSTSEFHEY